MSEAGGTGWAAPFRVLSLVLGLLALIGWGAFAYAAKSSATAQAQLRDEIGQMRQEVTRLKASQDQITAERDEAQRHLAKAQEQLADAQGQLTAVRQEAAALRKQLDEAQAKAPALRGLYTAAPTSSPARTSPPARTNRRRR